MITTSVLKNKNQTGREMHRLVNRYYTDLDCFSVRHGPQFVPISALSILEYFDFVRRIPYRKDVKGVEVVSRPIKIFFNSPLGMDCKKKTILICSYCRRHRIPYRMVASSKRHDGRIHHVFPQISLFGEWLNMDATYRKYTPFEPKNITRAEVI